MTDEEILHKLAEIEGLRILSVDADRVSYGVEPGPDGFVPDILLYWAPLANWHDCGPLQESHDVWTESDGDGWHGICDGCRSTDPDLKHAICLAIIESQAEEEAA